MVSAMKELTEASWGDLFAGKSMARVLHLYSPPVPQRGFINLTLTGSESAYLKTYFFPTSLFATVFSQGEICRNSNACNAQSFRICCLLRFWEPSIVSGPLWIQKLKH